MLTKSILMQLFLLFDAGSSFHLLINQQFLLCVLLVLCFVELKFVNKKTKGVLTLNEPTTYPLQVVLWKVNK